MDNKTGIKDNIEIDKTMVIFLHFMWVSFLIAYLIINHFIILTLVFLGLAIYFNIDMRYWQLRLKQTEKE